MNKSVDYGDPRGIKWDGPSDVRGSWEKVKLPEAFRPLEEGELMGRRLEVRVTYGEEHSTPEVTKMIAKSMMKLPHGR